MTEKNLAAATLRSVGDAEKGTVLRPGSFVFVVWNNSGLFFLLKFSGKQLNVKENN